MTGDNVNVASSIMLADYDGTIIEGDRDVEPTAFYIHSRIHKACPHAVCVMHTHMPYATALTLVEGGRLEPVEQGAIRFIDHVVYDDDYAGLALDTDEGDRIAAGLGNKSIMFMGAHGVTVTGSTIARTYDSLYYLERACEVQVLALSTGQPLAELDASIARRTKADFDQGSAYYQAHFDAVKPLLDRNYLR